MLTNRSLRRQIVAYVVLLAVAMLILAFSSSPPVTQLRRGVGYAQATTAVPFEDLVLRVLRDGMILK